LTAQPEARAREKIDRQLTDAGWIVQDRAAANLGAGPGVAVREFPLKGGPVDYLLYLDGAAAGAVEAKKEGWTLSGVGAQSKRYSEGLPDALPAYRRPLPFLYESTGIETQFTNLLDPEPRSREVFTFHRPETHREWLQQVGYEQSRRALPGVAEPPAPYTEGDTLRARLKTLPALIGGEAGTRTRRTVWADRVGRLDYTFRADGTVDLSVSGGTLNWITAADVHSTLGQGIYLVHGHVTARLDAETFLLLEPERVNGRVMDICAALS